MNWCQSIRIRQNTRWTSSLKFVGESRRWPSWLGHSVECRLAHVRCKLLRNSIMSVLDGQVKRRLTLVILLTDCCSTPAAFIHTCNEFTATNVIFWVVQKTKPYLSHLSSNCMKCARKTRWSVISKTVLWSPNNLVWGVWSYIFYYSSLNWVK